MVCRVRGAKSNGEDPKFVRTAVLEIFEINDFKRPQGTEVRDAIEL